MVVYKKTSKGWIDVKTGKVVQSPTKSAIGLKYKELEEKYGSQPQGEAYTYAEVSGLGKEPVKVGISKGVYEQYQAAPEGNLKYASSRALSVKRIDATPTEKAKSFAEKVKGIRLGSVPEVYQSVAASGLDIHTYFLPAKLKTLGQRPVYSESGKVVSTTGHLATYPKETTIASIGGSILGASSFGGLTHIKPVTAQVGETVILGRSPYTSTAASKIQVGSKEFVALTDAKLVKGYSPTIARTYDLDLAAQLTQRVKVPAGTVQKVEYTSRLYDVGKLQEMKVPNYLKNVYSIQSGKIKSAVLESLPYQKYRGEAIALSSKLSKESISYPSGVKQFDIRGLSQQLSKVSPKLNKVRTFSGKSQILPRDQFSLIVEQGKIRNRGLEQREYKDIAVFIRKSTLNTDREIATRVNAALRNLLNTAKRQTPQSQLKTIEPVLKSTPIQEPLGFSSYSSTIASGLESQQLANTLTKQASYSVLGLKYEPPIQAIDTKLKTAYPIPTMITEQKMIQEPKLTQAISTEIITEPKTAVEPVQIITPKVITQPRLITVPRTITSPKTPTVPKIPTIPKVPIIPFAFPNLDLLFKSKKIKPIKPKLRTKYQPSLAGLLLGKKTYKIPKILTGTEVRGIYVSSRRRKKRRKKR